MKHLMRTLAVLFVIATGLNLSAATVVTDRDDYPPGSTAVITGTGFLAGETVELQVLRIDINENSGPEHNPWQVSADANGGFTTAWYVSPDEDGATLQLTATGLTSGFVAQHIFTDGPVTPTLGAQSGALTYGTNQVATFTVTLSKSGGNNASVNLVALGLPSGATYKFTPNNFSTTVSTSSTLTITNGLTTPGGTFSFTVTNSAETTFGNGTLTIGKAGSAAVLTSRISAAPGVGVTFTNTLNAVLPSVGTPAGTVQFKTNGVSFGSPVTISGGVAVSAAISTLPHGSNTVTAEYVGDSNFFGTTNSLSPKIVINSPPVARSVSSSVSQGSTATINFDLGKYKLATDADADSMTIISAFGATNASLGVAANGLSMTYTNTGGAAGTYDAFSFVVSDSFGSLATNTATMRIDAGTGFNLLRAHGNSMTYLGVPGQAFVLENSTGLSPANWHAVMTNTVGADGIVTFTPGAPSGYYRTRRNNP